MKICTKCHQDKELSEFAFRNIAKGILQPVCRACKKELDKEDYKREGRKISVRKAQKVSHAKIVKYFTYYKKLQICSECGDSRHYVLEFHHINDDKLYNIGDMIRGGFAIKTIQKEIDKCIVLCANCHRELHYNEKLVDNQDA